MFVRPYFNFLHLQFNISLLVYCLSFLVKFVKQVLMNKSPLNRLHTGKARQKIRCGADSTNINSRSLTSLDDRPGNQSSSSFLELVRDIVVVAKEIFRPQTSSSSSPLPPPLLCLQQYKGRRREGLRYLNMTFTLINQTHKTMHRGTRDQF